MNILQSEYIFLDSFSRPIDNTKFTILTHNIHSVPSNFQYFADTVLAHPCIKCDVIGFCETRLDCDFSSVYQMPGYHQYTNSRNRHGGGVALYVSNKYQNSMCSDLCYLDSAIKCVSANIKINDKTFLVVCLYRPRRGNLNDFLVKISEFLSLAFNLNFHGIYMIGDYNSDLLKHSSNINVCEFINLMNSFHYFPY